MAAFLIDVAILFAVLAPSGWLLQRAARFTPTTGRQIWLCLVLTFSLPTWLYFIILDSARSRGTIGKRTLGLRVKGAHPTTRITLSRNTARTALKLTPWEIVHASAFAMSSDMASLTSIQIVGLIIGNALSVLYLATAAATHGRRSVHDLIANTSVGDTIPSAKTKAD